jgi:hypothetical protein
MRSPHDKADAPLLTAAAVTIDLGSTRLFVGNQSFGRRERQRMDDHASDLTRRNESEEHRQSSNYRLGMKAAQVKRAKNSGIRSFLC